MEFDEIEFLIDSKKEQSERTITIRNFALSSLMGISPFVVPKYNSNKDKECKEDFQGNLETSVYN